MLLELDYYGHVDSPAFIDVQTWEEASNDKPSRPQLGWLRLRKSLKMGHDYTICLRDERLDAVAFVGFACNRTEAVTLLAEHLYAARQVWNDIIRDIQDGKVAPRYALKHLAPHPSKSR